MGGLGRRDALRARTVGATRVEKAIRSLVTPAEDGGRGERAVSRGRERGNPSRLGSCRRRVDGLRGPRGRGLRALARWVRQESSDSPANCCTGRPVFSVTSAAISPIRVLVTGFAFFEAPLPTEVRRWISRG